MVEIFIGARCWRLSTRTIDQKGRPGAGREGGGGKNEKHLSWKILCRLCMASETTDISLAWNEMKNVPALYKCQIMFINKLLTLSDLTFCPIPPVFQS